VLISKSLLTCTTACRSGRRPHAAPCVPRPSKTKKGWLYRERPRHLLCGRTHKNALLVPSAPFIHFLFNRLTAPSLFLKHVRAELVTCTTRNTLCDPPTGGWYPDKQCRCDSHTRDLSKNCATLTLATSQGLCDSYAFGPIQDYIGLRFYKLGKLKLCKVMWDLALITCKIAFTPDLATQNRC
jgi:hypothetical protein